MNSSPKNRYEYYQVAPGSDWNHTPITGPIVVDTLIKRDHALTAFKILYGENSDPDNPSLLVLPPKFGVTFRTTVEHWFTTTNIDPQVALELGMLHGNSNLTQDSLTDTNED